MNQQDKTHIRSGGRRIELYAELGGYFYPDGRLNEDAFRAFLRESLKNRASEENQADGQDAEQWLSAYLEKILSYLEEKGMGKTTFRIFEVALDEGSRLGMEKLAVSPSRMKHMLSLAADSDKDSSSRTLDPDGKRQAIFRAALEVFSERGFHDATIDEIAAASSVGKGTVYRHFKSKEDLLERLLTEKSSQIVGELSAIFSDDKDVLTQIQDFIEHLVDFIEQNHVLYRLIQTEGLSPRSGKRTMFDEYLIANMPMLKERITSMNRTGKLKLTSFHTVAYGMLGFIDGVAHRWFRSGMDYPLRDEIPVILEVLFNGFAGKGSSGKVFFVAPEDKSNDPQK